MNPKTRQKAKKEKENKGQAKEQNVDQVIITRMRRRLEQIRYRKKIKEQRQELHKLKVQHDTKRKRKYRKQLRKQAAKDPDFAARLREKRKIEKRMYRLKLKQKKKNKESTNVDSGNDKREIVIENQNTSNDESIQHETVPIDKSQPTQWRRKQSSQKRRRMREKDAKRKAEERIAALENRMKRVKRKKDNQLRVVICRTKTLGIKHEVGFGRYQPMLKQNSQKHQLRKLKC